MGFCCALVLLYKRRPNTDLICFGNCWVISRTFHLSGKGVYTVHMDWVIYTEDSQRVADDDDCWLCVYFIDCAVYHLFSVLCIWCFLYIKSGNRKRKRKRNSLSLCLSLSTKKKIYTTHPIKQKPFIYKLLRSSTPVNLRPWILVQNTRCLD